FYISKTVDDSKKERARVLMEKFGIRTLEKKMPNELSGGERQRVAICRALINDPEIVFADEPTGNLDSKSGKIVIESLKDINEHMGKTIIMVTHDPQMASYCSRLILLKDGVILEDLENNRNQESFYQEIIGKMKEL
ncbi:MAG: ABC transporter ATP-binding protein, partial [Mediterraneibacter faecis]